jgi:putative addiction module component (TIGR02574 family)
LKIYSGGFAVAVTLEQFGLDRLPPEDRLELLELLWDSLGEGTFSPPDWHIRELERRRAAAEADPAAGVPWGEFKARWLGQA